MREVLKRVSLTLIALAAAVSISRMASADEALKIAFDKCPPHESGRFFTGGCGLILCESDSSVQTIKEDGSDRASLPHSGDGADRDPAFSPDGRYLAIAQASRLIVANHDGTNRQVAFDLADIDSRLRVAHPTWSPDGSRIALVAFQVGLTGERFVGGSTGFLWVVSSVDDTAITPSSRLTFTEVAEGHFHLPATARPAWNSAGTAFAFTMAVPDPDPAIDSTFDQLYTASLSGTDWSLRRLTTKQFSLGAHWGPRYGDDIAYSGLTPWSNTPPQRRSVTPGECRSTGSGTNPGITPGPSGFGDMPGIGTFCAPSSVTTVYEHDATPSAFDIYKIDPDTAGPSTPTNLTARWRTQHNVCWYTDGNPNPHRGWMQCQTTSQGPLEGLSFSPSWDISGNRIAFQTHKFGGYWTYIIDEDGEELDRFGPPANPEIVPAGGAVWFFRPNWSPNGDKIAVLGCTQNCTVRGGHGVVPQWQIFVSPAPPLGRSITALTSDSDGQVGNPSWGRVPIEFTPPPPPSSGENTGGPTVRNPKMVNACRPYSIDIEIRCDDPDNDLREVAGPYICSGPPEGGRLYTATGPDENIRIAPSRGTESTFHLYWNFWWQADLPADPATGRRAPMTFCFYCREVDRDPALAAWSREPTFLYFLNREECERIRSSSRGS